MLQMTGRYLIVAGLVLLILGGLFLAAGKLPWLGRLPGDIIVKKENFTFYFPLTTCILASILISALLYLISRK